MAGSTPNFYKMDCMSACIQGVLKVKVKGHVIRELSWILGMSYSVTDGLVRKCSDFAGHSFTLVTDPPCLLPFPPFSLSFSSPFPPLPFSSLPLEVGP